MVPADELVVEHSALVLPLLAAKRLIAHPDQVNLDEVGARVRKG